MSIFVLHNGRPGYTNVGFIIWVFVKQIRVYSYYVYIYCLNGSGLEIDYRYLSVVATYILLAISNIKCNKNFHLIKQVGCCYDELIVTNIC
jgi:hypothetical protein